MSLSGLDVIIVGGGIGGLTTALALHARGIRARVFEAVKEIKAVGVGISLMPHSTRFLDELSLLEELSKVAVTTKETTFFNRFGQFVYSEPTGCFAGYDWPQLQIHRGDLHKVLLDAFNERVGSEYLTTGHKCVGFSQNDDKATVYFEDPSTGAQLQSASGDLVIASEGLHSVIRKQLHPSEKEPRYSGVNMWRGVTRRKPYMTGASYVRAGWLTSGKMVIYPIRNNIDAEGNQLINWVAEIETTKYKKRDWNLPGKLDDFIGVFDDWRFDWLNVSDLIRSADMILEYPMVDQDPLPWWTQGRVTLLGDAAHPMVPRGSNGAGQAILDAKAIAAHVDREQDPVKAAKAYEEERLEATTKVVLTNRTNPPDVILREVFERTGDRPFEKISDIATEEEFLAITENYRRIAGYDKKALQKS